MPMKRKRRPARRKKEAESASFPTLFSGVLKALLTALICGVLFLAAGSGILLFTKDPDSHRVLFSLCVLFFDAALAGALAAKFSRTSTPLLASFLEGVLFLLLFFTVSLIFQKTGVFTTGKPIFSLFILPAALLGGVLRAPKRKRR